MQNRKLEEDIITLISTKQKAGMINGEVLTSIKGDIQRLFKESRCNHCQWSNILGRDGKNIQLCDCGKILNYNTRSER